MCERGQSSSSPWKQTWGDSPRQLYSFAVGPAVRSVDAVLILFTPLRTRRTVAEKSFGYTQRSHPRWETVPQANPSLFMRARLGRTARMCGVGGTELHRRTCVVAYCSRCI